MLEILFINSILIFGWHYATQFDLDFQTRKPTNKEICWWFRFYLGNLLDKLNLLYLAKPLYGCVVCMSSVYGTLGFWFTHSFTLHNLILWPVYLVALAGVNRLLKNLCQI